MDALSVLRRLTAWKPLLCLFMVFCAWPVVAGMVHMITHHAWMWMDIDAVLCGAKTLASGHSPYAIHPPTCAGVKPAAYVYAPQVAMLFAPFIKLMGIPGARLLFMIVLLWPATLFVLWFALVKKFPDIDIRWRWLALAALTPMTFLCANVGLVMHAMVLASLLLFPQKKRKKPRAGRSPSSCCCAPASSRPSWPISSPSCWRTRSCGSGPFRSPGAASPGWA